MRRHGVERPLRGEHPARRPQDPEEGRRRDRQTEPQRHQRKSLWPTEERADEGQGQAKYGQPTIGDAVKANIIGATGRLAIGKALGVFSGGVVDG